MNKFKIVSSRTIWRRAGSAAAVKMDEIDIERVDLKHTPINNEISETFSEFT